MRELERERERQRVRGIEKLPSDTLGHLRVSEQNDNMHVCKQGSFVSILNARCPVLKHGVNECVRVCKRE